MLNGKTHWGSSKHPLAVKMCLVGDMCVGKTSLAHVFLQQPFQEYYRGTIGAVVMARTLDDPYVTCQVWDTAGMERYRALLPHYMRKAVCAILVYDISSYESFVSIRDYWADFVDCCGEEGLVKVLVGNKMDMDKLRAVRSEMAAEWAETRGMVFMETSAKFGINVDAMFTLAARKAEAVPRPPTSPETEGFSLDKPTPAPKSSRCCVSRAKK
ncbi:ras-related protein rab-5a [Plakobranchus ocellatus]|uniref:Ras-related protein rab-5a n=1 Tax=Plakobranchus ocellatus TaxID=259542 RepID=A0AAV4CHY8_9GAST|nr:ras-related protein rab-5a [Plakobranchus ocellatus]